MGMGVCADTGHAQLAGEGGAVRRGKGLRVVIRAFGTTSSREDARHLEPGAGFSEPRSPPLDLLRSRWPPELRTAIAIARASSVSACASIVRCRRGRVVPRIIAT